MTGKGVRHNIHHYVQSNVRSSTWQLSIGERKSTEVAATVTLKRIN